jgi:pSer/pThr/pTyr-binding forkhead associated (FHA) protein
MPDTEQLIFDGIKGIAEGETFQINYGQLATIGRSRLADISLRRCPKYKELKPEDLKNEAILSISRKHLRIGFYNWQTVELKDLSTNGTYVALKPADSGEKKYERITRKVITNIKQQPYEIRLGTNETFILSAPTPAETPANGVSPKQS